MQARQLRVGILSPWASRLGGGVFEAVVAHADMIAAIGADPLVFALADAQSDVDRNRLPQAEVHLGRTSGPAQIGYSPELGRMLRHADLDLLHLHDIWMATSHIAANWAAETGRPYIISPHGMLDPWITARGRVKKQIARLGYERRSWARASLFHALTEAEASNIADETGRNAIAVIPNAVFIPSHDEQPCRDRSSGFVYLGRIHTKKNINALIDAWLQLRTHGESGTPALTIAGWGDPADVAALTAKVNTIGDPELRFIGPVFGDTKRRLIAGAVAVCLPSHSEGLPMVILEAWAAGIPTAMSQHCHLPEGLAAGAAVDCGTVPATIGAALATLAADSPAARTQRRNAARALVAERFSSDAVRGLWTETYDRLLTGTSLVHQSERLE